MDESTLILVTFIKDLMTIISIGILIVLLLLAIYIAISLIGSLKSIKRITANLEEASGVILTSTQDISKTLGFFGAINRVVERVRERFNRDRG